MLLDDIQNQKGKGEKALLVKKKDEELLELSLKNPHVFEELVHRYQEAFMRKALHIMGNREAAEDMVQEAFVKMYRHARLFTPVPGATLKSWGYRILVNTCYSAYKKAKREREFLAALEPELQELIADKEVSAARERELNSDEARSLIANLPKSLAEPLRLHFVEGEPHALVAERLGISEGAVRARVHRAKKELREYIAKRSRLPND